MVKSIYRIYDGEVCMLRAFTLENAEYLASRMIAKEYVEIHKYNVDVNGKLIFEKVIPYGAKKEKALQGDSGWRS